MNSTTVSATEVKSSMSCQRTIPFTETDSSIYCQDAINATPPPKAPKHIRDIIPDMETTKSNKVERKPMVFRKNHVRHEMRQNSSTLQSSGPFTGINDVINFSFSRSAQRTLRRHSFWVKTGSSSRRKTVIMTVANEHVSDMALNLRCFVKQTSSKEPIVFSLDKNMTRISLSNRIPSIPIYRFKDENMNLTESSKGTTQRQKSVAIFGTKRFSGISNSKLWLVYQVLRIGYDVILTDVDIIWCKDLISVFGRYINEFPDIDMFVQSNSRKDSASGQANTGFYYAKSTKLVAMMFEYLANGIIDAIERSHDDQLYFWNQICRKGESPCNGIGRIKKRTPDGNNHWICQWSPDNGTSISQVLFLSVQEFPNGASNPFEKTIRHVPKGYYRYQCQTKNITIWHANYIRGPRKKKIMKSQNVWILKENGTCEAL